MSARVEAALQVRSKKLLGQMGEMVRLKHYDLRTEQSYCDCVARFIPFCSHSCPRRRGRIILNNVILARCVALRGLAAGASGCSAVMRVQLVLCALM